MAELHAETLWLVSLLKQPAINRPANLHIFSSRMGNISSPSPQEWQYVAMESWFINGKKQGLVANLEVARRTFYPPKVRRNTLVANF